MISFEIMDTSEITTFIVDTLQENNRSPFVLL